MELVYQLRYQLKAITILKRLMCIMMVLGINKNVILRYYHKWSLWAFLVPLHFLRRFQNHEYLYYIWEAEGNAPEAELKPSHCLNPHPCSPPTRSMYSPWIWPRLAVSGAPGVPRRRISSLRKRFRRFDRESLRWESLRRRGDNRSCAPVGLKLENYEPAPHLMIVVFPYANGRSVFLPDN